MTPTWNEHDLEGAHRHSSGHRAELEKSEKAGCFYCLAVFDPREIRDWVDEDPGGNGQTALCPKCGIDSVIGSAGGVPISEEFLKVMNKYWF